MNGPPLSRPHPQAGGRPPPPSFPQASAPSLPSFLLHSLNTRAWGGAAREKRAWWGGAGGEQRGLSREKPQGDTRLFPGAMSRGGRGNELARGAGLQRGTAVAPPRCRPCERACAASRTRSPHLGSFAARERRPLRQGNARRVVKRVVGRVLEQLVAVHFTRVAERPPP